MTAEKIYIRLWIVRENKDQLYNSLAAQRLVIEEEMGTQLDWLPNPGENSRSAVLKLDIDSKDAANRKKIIDWFCDHVPSFYNAFRGRIDTLAASLPNT